MVVAVVATAALVLAAADPAAGGFDAALVRARAQGVPLVALVDDPDVPAADVAAVPGAIVWRGAIADVPARYTIVVAPTALVLRPDGAEIDRIDGARDDAAAFVRSVTALLAAPRDAIALLEGKLAMADSGAARFALLTILAEKKLVLRGERSALLDLERAATDDDPRRAAAAEEALYVLGSWQARVGHDDAGADSAWRELIARKGAHARIARALYVASLRRQKKDALAAKVAAQVAAPPASDGGGR